MDAENGRRPVPFVFGFGDTALAEAGDLPLHELHFDAKAICHAADSIGPVALRLGVRPPAPRLAGFSYNHVCALGAAARFPEGSEPVVDPVLQEAAAVDALREPPDYLASPLVRQRLNLLDTLVEMRPDAVRSIGHVYEGPVTTAVLLAGPQFLTMPYDDGPRAERLLNFCVDSAVQFARALGERLGAPLKRGPASIPDDFAGMFRPALFDRLVVPAWERMFTGLQATARYLHSELLHPEHLPALATLGIAVFDPSADQYVTPQLLQRQCPVPFTARVQSWHIRDLSAAELQSLYASLAACEPSSISFYMTSLADEPKIRALLEVARELAPRPHG